MPGAGLTVVSVGQARPDKLALKPYWGKPDVRNFREGDGNVGIIRSPVRAISLPDLSALGVGGAADTQRLPLAQVNDGFAAMTKGEVVRAVLGLN
jgi:hypothetical protein